MKDVLTAAQNLANQLVDAQGNVPVYHLSGMPSHWDIVHDARGTKHVPNYDKPVHDLVIPKKFIMPRVDAASGRQHLVYNPFYDKADRPDLQAEATHYNVIRVDGGVIEVTLEIPKPIEASIEFTLNNGQMITLRTGETKVTANVMDAARFIHNPAEPLAIRSTNSTIIYDMGLVVMSREVKDIGRLATGHKESYNWIK
ncbi:hypothetical protein [Pseudomonas phage D6]|nr:hypothetical protein [Pseudomonas phage D6]